MLNPSCATVPEEVVLPLQSGWVLQLRGIALVVCGHHLPQHIFLTLGMWLHHVDGDLMDVWAAPVDPRDGAFRDAHGLLADVHVVVGNAKCLGNALDENIGTEGHTPVLGQHACIAICLLLFHVS